MQWRIPPPLPSPLLLDQTEARRAEKNVLENNTEALVISKRLKLPKDDRTIAPPAFPEI